MSSIARGFESTSPEQSTLPAEFLNAYEIENADRLSWQVSLLKIERTDGQPLTHSDRGRNKSIVWDLYRKYKSRCRGGVFVIDVDRNTVAVPASWNLPLPEEFEEEFIIYLGGSIRVSAANSQHHPIMLGLIRDGLRWHFKNNSPEDFGPLWQDFGRFCQRPQGTSESDYSFCRRFDFRAKILRGRRWVVEFPISTTAIDNRSFADYYRTGQVGLLVDMIEAKRGERLNRRNQPVGTRVLRYVDGPHTMALEAVELSEEVSILSDAQLSESQQKDLAAKEVRCLKFPTTERSLPLEELRLILGPQNTLEDHAETIVSPAERVRLMSQLRSFTDGIDIYGQTLRLAPKPFDATALEGGFMPPPAVCVNGPDNQKIIIQPPKIMTEASLRERTRLRSQHIRQNGFIVQRPINPLLACPQFTGESSARRMQEDLNYLLAQQGIDYRFGLLRFRSVDEIRRVIEQEGFDSAVVVLPPSRFNDNSRADLHEQVKQRLEVPSQCIQLRNTMPKDITCSLEDLHKRNHKRAARIQQRYEMVILNLLVKHHWLPFLPVGSFFNNVQVGIDVGGEHNTSAVSCLGYGFANPTEGLIFRPDAIPIGLAKAEPIPRGSLFAGLLNQFDVLHSELAEVGLKADFERVLFLHDGDFGGDIERSWDETDDLRDLHKELLRREWISSDSVWTAVEVKKVAEDWRLFRGGKEGSNPLGGRYIFPYDDENIVLVTTTGAQYVTQGTSNPLMLRIIDLYGCADRAQVIRDIVWGADMCFTKPDVGMRLPWVLHVADSGALQQARFYKVTGITV